MKRTMLNPIAFRFSMSRRRKSGSGGIWMPTGIVFTVCALRTKMRRPFNRKYPCAKRKSRNPQRTVRSSTTAGAPEPSSTTRSVTRYRYGSFSSHRCGCRTCSPASIAVSPAGRVLPAEATSTVSPLIAGPTANSRCTPAVRPPAFRRFARTRILPVAGSGKAARSSTRTAGAVINSTAPVIPPKL